MSLKHWWVWSACLLSKYSISNQPSQHFPFLRSNTFSSVFAKRQAVRHLEAPKAQHELPRHRGVLSPYSCQLPRGVRVCVIISPSTRLTGYDSARAKSELNARINELRGSWGQERGWREAPCLFGPNCICPAGEKFLIDASDRGWGWGCSLPHFVASLSFAY